MTLPDDLLINPKDEVAIRQRLTASRAAICPPTGASGWGGSWTCIRGCGLRIRRDRHRRAPHRLCGPLGSWPGTAAETVDRSPLMAVPGFGEVHKRIESSSHLSPEWEAALVLPRGNTWTCEASHEFSNVDGPQTLDFWLAARLAGSPLKIFPLPGSAVPPTASCMGRRVFRA